MGRLDGKVAIVTGGARGMGAETVRLFAQEGASVVIADMLIAEGSALAAEIGGAALFHPTNIAREEDWAALVEATTARFGQPDILVNNAAMQRFASILDCDVADFRSVLDVNLIGTFIGLKLVGALMVRRGRGSIVNISSVDGMRGANGYAAYSTSKWGVRGLTKVAAMEFGPRGVRVNSVHPGGVFTVMGNPTGETVETIDGSFGMVPLQRTGRPGEVVAASLFLASDEASYVCGAELAVDGGWTAGIYNPMLSGSPDDHDYGLREGAHPLNAHFDAALAAKAAVPA
ncbi:glucose 1-dehydrogenase [Sphingomonas sp. RP10(2022)]|uniref:Glucose 1-dehydrogenase n=1 Tax=Sphingomonas liriopis TaxID=2949094 RepID=A0A9X2KP59_9SPHN|nr:glucose 1-dehydrogenase [Sphingomonas liriopis]MCP3733525.1 glucose 1-dehydrogenase [Sphingomonas liriopis]